MSAMDLRKASDDSPLYEPRAVTPVMALIAAFLVPYCLLASAVLHGNSHLSTCLSNDRASTRRAKLDPAQSKEIDRACTLIREIGERVIVPLLRSIEAEDRDRHLVHFDRRFKDPTRLKHKVALQLCLVPGCTLAQGLAEVHDAVRFTLQYTDARYVAGVRQDMARLANRGLVRVGLLNTWANDQYKGINTRWREPTSGLLFEVQFHTQASFAARELTHAAYEQIRGDFIEETERAKLRAFQRDVITMVPVPPGILDVV